MISIETRSICGKIGAHRPTCSRADEDIVILGPCPLPPGHEERCDLRPRAGCGWHLACPAPVHGYGCCEWFAASDPDEQLAHGVWIPTDDTDEVRPDPRWKFASDLASGDGVEFGTAKRVVKTVEPYGKPIDPSMHRVTGAKRTRSTEAVWVCWTDGYRDVIAVDYPVRTFDPATLPTPRPATPGEVFAWIAREMAR